MHAERREYRLTFTNVDRGSSFDHPLVISREPVESLDQLTLRVLSFMLLYDEGLAFALGSVAHEDEPDLVARDLTGRVSVWVVCGDVTAKQVRRIVQHNRGAAIHVVFGTLVGHDVFLADVASWGGDRPRGWSQVQLWRIEEALVAALAAREDLRQRWAATVVGDQIYVEADGATHEGPVFRG